MSGAKETIVPVDWPPGPGRPAIESGAIHVWCADIAGGSKVALRSLSDEEHARASRFPRHVTGRRWARSRAVLRALLGLYLQADPADVSLRREPSGALSLLSTDPLSFSVSHSGPLALYAFGRGTPVGVDVELGGQRIDDRALASRLMGPEDAARLQSLPPVERRREFLRAWTRREALVKCGRNLSFEPWVIDLDVGPAGAAALAAMSQLRPELRCWSWTAA